MNKKDECVVTIQNNHDSSMHEYRLYSTYSLAKNYMREQAKIYDSPWDGSDKLVTDDRTIWITKRGSSSPRQQKQEKQEQKCMLL